MHAQTRAGEIAHCLAYLHNRGIVHGARHAALPRADQCMLLSGDVKPFNVLSIEGHLKLIDLGAGLCATCDLAERMHCRWISENWREIEMRSLH